MTSTHSVAKIKLVVAVQLYVWLLVKTSNDDAQKLLPMDTIDTATTAIINRDPL